KDRGLLLRLVCYSRRPTSAKLLLYTEIAGFGNRSTGCRHCYAGRMLPVALSIAGSDPSGGAGLQADLKTFHQFGVYGEAIPTLITVQNSLRVSRVEVLEPGLVAEQIAAVLEDMPPHA